MENYGTLIKQIRQEKGLSQKEIYTGIMTRQTYYLIENNISMPSFDKFLMILEKLFLTVEEFLALLDPETFPNENKLYYNLSQAVLNKDKPCLVQLIHTSEKLYQTTKNEKYYHFSLVTKAMLHLNFTNTLSKQSKTLIQIMRPIKKYLTGIDKWYLYELKLLNNSLYCFSLSEAISLGLLVTKKIDLCQQIDKYQEVKLMIYLNLSFLCLASKEYKHTITFARLAKKDAKKGNRLFESVIANLNYEIALVASELKVMNGDIETYLTILKTLDFNQTLNDYQKILSQIDSH